MAQERAVLVPNNTFGTRERDCLESKQAVDHAPRNTRVNMVFRFVLRTEDSELEDVWHNHTPCVEVKPSYQTDEHYEIMNLVTSNS